MKELKEKGGWKKKKIWEAAWEMPGSVKIGAKGRVPKCPWRRLSFRRGSVEKRGREEGE